VTVSELEPVAQVETEADIETIDETIDETVVDSGDDGDLDTDVLEDDDVLLLEEVEVETELVLPVWEPTGDAQVDAALDLLTTLDPDDVHQHAAVFDEIHQGLRGRLTDLDAS
jgi:hypothetical protein